MRLIPWNRRRQMLAAPAEPYEPVNTLGRMRAEMDRLFDRFIMPPLGAFEERFPSFDFRGWSPRIDVAETDNEITVTAELPGIDPKDLDITVSDNILTISGEKREEKEEKGEAYYHSERHYGSFSRSIELPPSADKDKVAAEQVNGVLKVHVPKLAGAKSRHIEVKQTPNKKAERVPVGAR